MSTLGHVLECMQGWASESRLVALTTTILEAGGGHISRC